MDLDIDRELAKAERLAAHKFATDSSAVLVEVLGRLKRVREIVPLAIAGVCALSEIDEIRDLLNIEREA